MEKTLKRRRFGRTELFVTELGFGAMNLRNLNSFEEAYNMVNYVLDSGVNLIDTARAYSGEIAPGVLLESEKVLAEVIKKRDNLKEPIVIITKGHGYTLEELEKDLSLSINALQIQGTGDLKIGNNPIKLVYFLHGISTERWEIIKTSGVLEQLKVLKKEGRVNFVGFSSHYPFTKEVKEAVDTNVFDVVELPYNVFNRTFSDNSETDIFKYISDKDIGIVNMKAFDGNGMVPIYKTIREFISIDYEKMLNFCLSNPYISTVDAGAKFIHEFEMDMKTALMPRLSEEEKRNLTDEADKVSKHMKDLCRQCMHCMEKFECPSGIPFVDSLAAYSKYQLSKSLGKDISKYVSDYKGLTKNGKDCTECGACLPWCEYKLNIPEMMKNAQLNMI